MSQIIEEGGGSGRGKTKKNDKIEKISPNA
jgi:hypothetical protein